MQNILIEVFPMLDKARELWNKALDWLIEGPENKLFRIFVYWPVFLVVGALAVFLIIGVLPELVAWGFGLSCIIWCVYWPIAKVYELITGRKVL